MVAIRACIKAREGDISRLESDGLLCLIRGGRKEQLGKQETTLPVLLFSEYRGFKAKERGGRAYQKTKDKMLAELRVLASDKPGWGEFICNMR